MMHIMTDLCDMSMLTFQQLGCHMRSHVFMKIRTARDISGEK
jgi:hypothetical protein